MDLQTIEAMLRCAPHHMLAAQTSEYSYLLLRYGESYILAWGDERVYRTYLFCWKQQQSAPTLVALTENEKQDIRTLPWQPYTVSVWDVLQCLEGHCILPLETLFEICAVVHVPVPVHLIMTWANAEDAKATHDFMPTRDGPGAGVWDLDVSYYLCEHFGLGRPGAGFTGKGFQTKANKQALMRYFGVEE